MKRNSIVRGLAIMLLTVVALTACGCAAGRSSVDMRTVEAEFAAYRARFSKTAERHRVVAAPDRVGRDTDSDGRSSGRWVADRLGGGVREPSTARTAFSNTAKNHRAPLPGFWETVKRDLTDFPDVFWQDTKDVFTNRQNIVILGLTYGASFALHETGPDHTVQESFRTHSTFKKSFRDSFAAIGNPGTQFGLAGLWYLIGQRTQDEKTYNVGTKLFRTLAVTGVVTLLGQTATWDRSPNGDWGTLPSGHASSSFAFASVMHHEYGPWVGGPLYVLSGFVSYSRLEDEEHFLSDVVMGGVLGLVVGHTIANDGEPPKLFGGDITPYANPRDRTTGIAWVKNFR